MRSGSRVFVVIGLKIRDRFERRVVDSEVEDVVVGFRFKIEKWMFFSLYCLFFKIVILR